MSNTVIEVTKMHFQGNIIDDGWYEHLKYDNGKPNFNAILILSEIVYWYRARVERDEFTGEVLGYRKKFKADKLQKSYQALGDRFGITKRQAKLACDFLKEKGIIEIELRTIEINKTKFNNVMYVDLNVENLKKITGLNRLIDEINIPPIENNNNISNSNDNTNIPHPSTIECNSLLQQDVTPVTTECKTNTKITTEINLEEEETFNQYEDTKGKKLTKADKTNLSELLKTYSKDITIRAIKEMSLRADTSNIKYLQNTLNDWYSKGLKTIELVEKHLAEREVQKAKVKENREKAIENAADSKSKTKKDSFNNYEQRDYTPEQFAAMEQALSPDTEDIDGEKLLQQIRNKSKGVEG